MKIIDQAKKIALRDLRACYHGDGVLASLVNYSDYWARDTFWASFGILEIGDDEQVKKSLLMFIKHQLKNGKIPRKIKLDYNNLKYFKIKIERSEPKPAYKSAIGDVYSTDDNLLFVIAFCLYVEKTRDYDFAGKYFKRAYKALAFYKKEKMIFNDLIAERGISNWMDTIMKDGYILYTNCLWFEAVRKMEHMLKNISQSEEFNLPSSKKIHQKIQKIFWKNDLILFEDTNKPSSYFVDYVTFEGEVQPYFDLAGNMLAVLFGVTDKEQAERIIEIVDYSRLHPPLEPVGEKLLHPCVYPRYPFWKVRPIRFITAAPNYQNGISWSWLEALVIAAKLKSNKESSATQDLKRFSKVIVENKEIHETYNLDGSPYDSFLWRSAVPFAWGAGLFLWANKFLEKKSSK